MIYGHIVSYEPQETLHPPHSANNREFAHRDSLANTKQKRFVILGKLNG